MTILVITGSSPPPVGVWGKHSLQTSGMDLGNLVGAVDKRVRFQEVVGIPFGILDVEDPAIQLTQGKVEQAIGGHKMYFQGTFVGHNQTLNLVDLAIGRCIKSHDPVKGKYWRAPLRPMRWPDQSATPKLP